MKVRDVMTEDVVSARTDTPFRELVRLLDANRVGAVPVVDDAGRILGVVSSSDLLVKEEGAPRPAPRPPAYVLDRPSRSTLRRAAGTLAGSLMTSPAVTIEDQIGVREAARLMSSYGVRHLPVARAGVLAGIVSRSDLLKVFLRSDAEIRQELVDEALPSALLTDVSALSIDVDDGVVSLVGALPRGCDVDLIKRAVWRVDGVVGVVDAIDGGTGEVA